MTWTQERDDLIAQTMAFVQSVTSRRPEPGAVTSVRTAASVRTAIIENPFAYRYAPSVSQTSAAKPPSIDDLVSAQVAQPGGTLPRTELPPIRPFAHGEVRREIQNRIAAFQAHQHRFHRERDAYCNSVMSKARSTIENGILRP